MAAAAVDGKEQDETELKQVAAEAEAAAVAEAVSEAPAGPALPKEIPSVLFVLPVLYFAKDFVWTEQLVMYGQALITCEVLFFMAVTLYISNGIEAATSNKAAQLTLPAAKFPAATPEQKKEESDITVSAHEMEVSQLFEARKAMGMSLAVVFFAPWVMKVNQPIIMQSLLVPIVFLRNKLFKMYVLGFQYENPWDATSVKDKDE